ncbi:hypothetical protein QR685DRAFT_536616 [Neurospora intermedia]|uniref:Secreted protein n=1 Tax=Neurospora intermedia TaxID=5142 RepID=A0ABR3D001_NEUIN
MPAGLIPLACFELILPCLCNIHLEPAWLTCLVRCVLRGHDLHNELQGCPSAVSADRSRSSLCPVRSVGVPRAGGVLIAQSRILDGAVIQVPSVSNTRCLQQALLRRARASGRTVTVSRYWCTCKTS